MEGRVPTYWLETLGCPKNEVDSDKLAHRLSEDGYLSAPSPERADLIVVNTCAFIDAARRESIDSVLALADAKADRSRLVVTGCLAERYGEELAAALPEVDLVAGFGAPLVHEERRVAHSPVELGSPRRRTGSSFDLLEAPRGPAGRPWAYVKVAEGCDRQCGFCAIPSFRGPQRSRRVADLVAEVESLVASQDAGPPVREVVLVAQDLASFGRDRTDPGGGRRRKPGEPLLELLSVVSPLVSRTRLLYLYPSSLTEELVEAVVATGVPYFDLSLQHVSRPLLTAMRRFGHGDLFLRRIEGIRRAAPEATLRSSFIVGYPGETEEDHDALLGFLERAELDWAGFFPFSKEEGTLAATLGAQVPHPLAMERLRECAEVQDAITERRRRRLVGQRLEVLVDCPGQGRSVHEAPEIDGVVHLPDHLVVGDLVEVEITAAAGADLWAEVSPGGAP
jgi:ribosomal protein S12 methylthiotransferase